MQYNIKNIRENAEYLQFSNDNIIDFDYLYIIPTRRKHDSGYKIMEIYGEVNNKLYCLSKCSDVVDFEKANFNYGDFSWFASFDMPEYNVIRIFARDNRKFRCIYKHLSSFQILILK